MFPDRESQRQELWKLDRKSFYRLHRIRISDAVASQVVESMRTNRRHQAAWGRNLRGVEFRPFVLDRMLTITFN